MASLIDPECPVCAARLAMDAADGIPLAVVEACPGAQGWIDIALTDHRGEPVVGARYEVEAADGSLHTGTLDADGCATLRGIEPGPAVVRFPEHHRDEFDSDPAPACRCVQATWVDIELVDEAGAPVAGAPYEVVFADGEVCEGVLDARGRARVESLVDGPCRVRFPELERGACDLG